MPPFEVPGTRLLGKCNQCGLCCFDGGLRCFNLEVVGLPGQPMATRCRVYETRFNGMPIVMVGPHNKIVKMACCSKDCAVDDEMIIQKGIGKGCSLRVP